MAFDPQLIGSATFFGDDREANMVVEVVRAANECEVRMADNVVV